VYLAVLLGMGIPGLAVLRPLLGAGLAEAVLVLAVIGASSVLWRRLGDAEGELRSGAIDVARVLAQHAEETVDGTPPAENRAFDGLADVVEMRIELDSAAVNATLAQLDVRARTGATVVAIHKAGANVVFPSALERLDAGDVVAVMGSAEAIELARALISAPAPAASGADARSTG
jgi:CPA2 family monovalent cation:H+ antiporter-2